MKSKRLLSKTMAMALALTCSLLPPGNLRAEGMETGGSIETQGSAETRGSMETGEPPIMEEQMEVPSETGAPPGGAPGTQENADPVETGELPETEELWREEIVINTAEEFLAFAQNCFIDSWSADKRILLNADIDLTGVDFGAVPVFAGVFDGQGHWISGVTYGGDGYVAGLFRYIEKGGLVENLTLKGEITAADEKECIGGLCGVNYGTIRGCSFQGNVSGRTAVGGLAGVNEGTGVIADCTAGGSVTGYYSTGGIAGRNHGALISCVNRTCINNDSEWVEEDDEMGVGLFLDINVSESGMELFSGVDTGGIAGHSDGVISGCTNYGTIGYDHTGYNIGGIAGRQSGVVSGCTNHGRIFGRKDVGGIVGQMEPYIEVDEAESLRNAVNKLHDLIEKTIDDMQAGKNVVKGDLDSLAAYSEGAVDAGDALADQLADFMDSNLDQVQSAAARMEHVMDMLPAVFDAVYAAEDSFSGANELLRRVMDSLSSMGDILGGYLETDVDGALGELQAAAGRVNAVIDEIRSGSGADPEQIVRLVEGLEEMSGGIQAVISSMSEASSQLGQQALDRFRDVIRDMREVVNRLQGALESVRTASRSAGSIVDYLNAQPDLHFSKLGGAFDVNRENLHGQLRGMSAGIQNLSSHASEYSDVVNDDLRAVNDQINVIFNLLADNLMNYGELSAEEFYEEIEEEDMENITTGKTAGSVNKGIIKGDINVGGIAGAMSIDEEDPEDSAAGSVDYQIGRRYFTKCIVTDCVNEGFVTAKKDGAGGIVGYMKHGIVADSESYGNIESTEGDYVGGICGQSHTVIRRCFALCTVSGGRNVGGIAGFADTLTDCYAMADCIADAGRVGAVAGQTVRYEDAMNEEEVKVSGNYYVGGRLYGIDNISYAGVAEPISYQELLTVEGLPSQFWHLKAVFRVEDRYLGVQEVEYGESLSGLEFPDIPEKEGFYGVWPDCSDKVMTGNLLIDGWYQEDVRVVQSSQTLGQDAEAQNRGEKPYALAESRFTEDTVLNAAVSDRMPPEAVQDKENIIYDITLENAQLGDMDVFAVRLYNPYSDAVVWGYRDGAWTLLESRARGQYLQVDMTGASQSFCVAERGSRMWILVLCGAGGGAVLLLFLLLVRKAGRRKRKKEQRGA